jgi:hypothetical protein
MRCNYLSKGVAVLGGGGRNSSRGVASTLLFAHLRVRQSLSKERSAFQCIASADNNVQIIRSETIFFPKMKNCQSDTCKTKLTLGNAGQQKQKAKDCRAVVR